ncbi:MAG: glycoside hydrolase family 28 protein [Tunicatimonas sp.]
MICSRNRLLRRLLIVLFPLIPVAAYAQTNRATFDVRRYGAQGDGRTMDTEAIQQAIDSCHRAGGGTISLVGGTFVSGTLYLKSYVTLYLEAGAVLRGSDDIEDFPSIPSRYPSYTGTLETNKALIYAEDARQISILGRGTIDGNGDHWVNGPYGFPSFSKRPRIIHLRACENVNVRDVTLRNSASWVQSYQSCRNLLIDGITVDSRENKDIERERYADVPGRNTDGLDLVDCERVRISNCYINSGDDAICLKSFSPDEACRDITISNCVVSSNASGIKIGTETSGRIEDVTIQNCVVYDTRRDAISVMSVDGARIERISISNVSLRNIKGSAIFMRLGNRNRTYRDSAKVNIPHLKDIIVRNVQGTRISAEYGNIVAGIKETPVENVLLENINLTFEGGGKAAESRREIPENEQEYPNGLIFGNLPAYGFYIRHAKNVTLDNVQLRFLQEDERPALIADDVEQLKITGLKASASRQAPELIRFIDINDALITESRARSPVPVFLSMQGDQSASIILHNNWLKNAQRKISFEHDSLKTAIQEFSSLE